MSINKERLCMGCMSALEQGVEQCPHCGYRMGQPADHRWLMPGTELAKRYLVGRVRSQNGEGAVYMGYDQEEDRKVWIQEYLPGRLGRRNESDGSVLPVHGREAQYKSLLYDFIENAQLLRELGAKAGTGLVPALDLVGQGGAAYAIYRHIEAQTLSRYLKENGGELGWTKAKVMFLPLLKTLGALHARGIIHRGISPDTLLVDSHEKLWLFGFALPATRTAGSELEYQLFDGYSAPEQYAANGWQGTWSDVYAAAAVLYRMLTGTMPVAAEQRWEKDSLYPANRLSGTVPAEVSAAIDGAMLLSVERRTQTVEQLLAELLADTASNTAVFDVSRLPAAMQEEEAPAVKKRRRGFPFPLKVMLVTTVVLGIVMAVVYFKVVLPSMPQPSQSSEPESSQPSEPEPPPSVPGVPDFANQYIQNLLNDPAYQGVYTFVEQKEYNEEGVPEGVVFGQSTPPGTPMPNKGATIILYVSKGSRTVAMPYLVGSTLGLATRTLDDLSIKYTVHKKVVEGADPGLVLETSVPAGESVVREQDVVILTIKEDIPVSIAEESSSEEEYQYED